MNKDNKITQNTTKEDYPYLWRGDIVNVSKELGCTYQKVRDFLRGNNNDQKIQATLSKLNEARRKQTEVISNTATENIINQ